jgi:glycine cleavage system transcriptional repressor
MTTPTEIFLVLSALGPDRPGLVAEITGYLTERGANVEDSRMAVLGGEFGVLILVSGAPEAVGAIERNKAALAEKTGLELLLRRTKSPEEHRRAASVPYVVTAEALDHEGIVRAVSRALHGAGVNIASLETSTYQAPDTGTPLFRLEARIDLPPEITADKLRQSLEAVAEQEDLDIEVRTLTRGG